MPKWQSLFPPHMPWHPGFEDFPGFASSRASSLCLPADPLPTAVLKHWCSEVLAWALCLLSIMVSVSPCVCHMHRCHCVRSGAHCQTTPPHPPSPNPGWSSAQEMDHRPHSWPSQKPVIPQIIAQTSSLNISSLSRIYMLFCEGSETTTPDLVLESSLWGTWLVARS